MPPNNALTDEQIAEARCLRQYVYERGQDELEMIALIIARVRAKATNDALERAAVPFDNWPRQSIAHGDYVAAKIRALKDQPLPTERRD